MPQPREHVFPPQEERVARRGKGFHAGVYWWRTRLALGGLLNCP